MYITLYWPLYAGLTLLLSIPFAAVTLLLLSSPVRSNHFRSNAVLALSKLNLPGQNTFYMDTKPVQAQQALYDLQSSEVDLLIRELQTCIQENYPAYAPLALLLYRLQRILQAHPLLWDSACRPQINALLVSDCEELGLVLLTETEVNLWWDENFGKGPRPGPAPLPIGWPR